MATPIIPPRRQEEFFEKNRDFTLRAFRFFEELTDTSNDTSVTIEDLEENQIILEARAITQAAIFNQQKQHDSSDNRIESLEVRPQVSQASMVKQQQQTDALGERVETVEVDLSTRPRAADLFRVNQRINELIDKLITEIRAIAPDIVAQNKALSLQIETLQQLKLLNLRTEEAFETDLNEVDL